MCCSAKSGQTAAKPLFVLREHSVTRKTNKLTERVLSPPPQHQGPEQDTLGRRSVLSIFFAIFVTVFRGVMTPDAANAEGLSSAASSAAEAGSAASSVGFAASGVGSGLAAGVAGQAPLCLRLAA